MPCLLPRLTAYISAPAVCACDRRLKFGSRQTSIQTPQYANTGVFLLLHIRDMPQHSEHYHNIWLLQCLTIR